MKRATDRLRAAAERNRNSVPVATPKKATSHTSRQELINDTRALLTRMDSFLASRKVK